MIKREGEHCLDCEFGMKVNGCKKKDDPRTKLIECNNSRVPLQFMKEHNWDLGEAAEDCKHFKSVTLSTRCVNCHEPIEGKKSEWEYWAIGPLEDVPVCSESCQKEVQKVMDEQEKDLQN